MTTSLQPVRSSLSLMLSLLLTIEVGGCNELTGNPGLPAGTPNPSTYNTKSGALGMRYAAILQFEESLPGYIVDAGLLTDELEDLHTGASLGTLLAQQGVSDPLDERLLPEGSSSADVSYANLQNIRATATQAIRALSAYDTAAADVASATIFRGELYAFEGYADVLLADLFCSGVPLSTLDFQHDFTYASSSTTTQLYHDAIEKFDTALTLASANDSVMHLAQVGRGRAFLDLGQFDSATAAVAHVPDGFHYHTMVQWGNQSGIISNILNAFATVADQEGRNGLPYRSNNDPRTAVITVQTTDNTGAPLPVPLFFPVKYNAVLNADGYALFPVADGIEARLIHAEAALHAGDISTWLTLLNNLRTTATVPGQSTALPVLTDPGVGLTGTAADSARVTLLFQERAYWLFLTGHRQGDLRRLLRAYHQYAAFNDQSRVYPTGSYLAPGSGVYGTDVTAPIPSAEFANPNFHGCLDRNP